VQNPVQSAHLRRPKGQWVRTASLNVDQNSSLTTTVGIANDSRILTGSSVIYGKTQYDVSHMNVWTVPVSHSLGSVAGSFSITLPQWSVTAIILQ